MLPGGRAMFGLMMVVFWIVFIGIAVSAVLGFVRTRRFTGRMFDHVERELVRRTSAKADDVDRRCRYCGSRAGEETTCRSCGAPLS